MDFFIHACAWATLAWSVFSVGVTASLGEAKPVTRIIAGLLEAACAVPAGRVLGWW